MNLFSFLKNGRGPKWTLILTAATLLTASIAYVIILPVITFFRSGPGSGQTVAYDSLTAATDSSARDALFRWRDLKLESAVLTAQLRASRLDSIYLYFNLNDSVAAIQFNGVTLRQRRINRFYAGPAFAHIRQSAEAENWLARPLVAAEEWSSFVKHPFKIKSAPKDTLEALAMKQDIMKPEPIDAYFTILFDRNVLLRVRQIEKTSKNGLWKLISYEISFRYAMLKKVMGKLIRFQAPPHHLLLDVRLPQADIVAMFRALPDQCSMVLIF